MEFKQFFNENEQAKLKLFGTDASRVTNQEALIVFNELKTAFQHVFSGFELVRSLPTKQDHGDIDILVIYPDLNVQSVVLKVLGVNVLKYNRNAATNSFLFKSSSINKVVHVDFIVSKNSGTHASKITYYSFNDAAAIIGMVARELHFKYGSEGFFKRFEDKKGMWHDILITTNLLDGLRIIGLDPHAYETIRDKDDIVELISKSPLVDASFFAHDVLISRDRQAVNKRPGTKYIIDKLRDLNLHSSIQDEDYLLKKLFPAEYMKVEQEKIKINSLTYQKSEKYNGHWLMQAFGLKSGPQVGKVLKAIHDRFGDSLENMPEETITAYVKSLL